MVRRRTRWVVGGALALVAAGARAGGAAAEPGAAPAGVEPAGGAAVELERAVVPAPQALLYAVYGSRDGAREAYQALRRRAPAVEPGARVIVTKKANGKLEIRHAEGARPEAAAAASAVVEALGGAPPAALAGGPPVTVRRLGMTGEMAFHLGESLPAGASALVVVVDAQAAGQARAAIAPAAQTVVEHGFVPPAPVGAPAQGPDAPAAAPDEITLGKPKR